MRMRFAVALLGLVLVCGSGELKAQDTWSYEITPTVWVAGVDGTTIVEGRDGPIRLEFDGLWHMEAGPTGLFQAQRGKWGYLLDFASARVPIGDADAGLQFYTAGATYQLSSRNSSLNLVFGLRYASSRSGVRMEVEDPDEDATDDERYMRVGSSSGWVDAMVGLQYVRPFGDRWAFDGWVDAGVGQGLSFQLGGGFSYQVSPAWSAKAGYRIIDGNYDKDAFDFDALFGGFYAGVGIRF